MVCANGLSLVAAQRIAPKKTPTTTQSTSRPIFRRGGASSTIGSSIFTSSFGGMLTGFPHFRQNWASSGRVAPHLLHPRRTLVADYVVLVGDIITNFSALGHLRLPGGFGGRATAGTAL